MTQTRLETATGGANKVVAKWPREKLGRVCVIVRGSSPRPKGDARYYGGNVPRLMVEDCTRDGIYVTPRIDFLTDEGAKLSRPMAAGDVVIVVSGNPGLPAILAVDCCIHDGFVGLRQLNKDRVSSDYLYHYLSFIKSHTDSQATGAIFRNLTTDQVANVEILLPPLAEQRRIAGRLREQLAEVAKARTAVQAQLAAAQALAAAFARAVFDSEEARQWDRIPLDEICLGNGQYGTSERSMSEQNGLPVLRMGNLFDGHVLWDDLKYAELLTAELDKYRLVTGDLIFNRTNSVELVGKSAVFDGSREAIFASYLVRFRLRPDRADSHFVCAFINSQFGRAFIDANMTRAIGQANVSASTMKAMPIPLPHITVQRSIAARLAAELAEVTRLRESLSGKLETLDRLPAALLVQAFQGDSSHEG